MFSVGGGKKVKIYKEVCWETYWKGATWMIQVYLVHLKLQRYGEILQVPKSRYLIKERKLVRRPGIPTRI